MVSDEYLEGSGTCLF